MLGGLRVVDGQVVDAGEQVLEAADNLGHRDLRGVEGREKLRDELPLEITTLEGQLDRRPPASAAERVEAHGEGLRRRREPRLAGTWRRCERGSEREP